MRPSRLVPLLTAGLLTLAAVGQERKEEKYLDPLNTNVPCRWPPAAE